jgi:hypothetical protein
MEDGLWFEMLEKNQGAEGMCSLENHFKKGDTICST